MFRVTFEIDGRAGLQLHADVRNTRAVHNRVHVHVAGDVRDELAAVAGQNVHHAAGQIARGQNLRERRGRQWKFFREITIAALPLKITGAVRETSASSDGSSGARTTTTPVGSGVVKLKCDVATGFTLLKICEYLSVQPAKCTSRSIASVNSRFAFAALMPVERAISFTSSVARFCNISAAR